MAAERQVFIYGNKAEFDAGQDLNYAPGCVANGITEDVAAEIWEQMANFAKYAFNRSHAACYAWIGFITAYMSCHWPTEFYAALLNAFIENSDKVKAYLSQAARRGIQLLPPNVNRSECQFKPEQDGIRFGLQGISGLKSQAVGIVREREDGGAYADFQDLYDRLAASGNKLNRTAAEGLIWGGALSSLPESGNQAALLKLFPLLENNYKKEGVFQSMGQMSMFSEAQKISMPEVPDVSEEESLKKEREMLGIYIHGHPSQKLLSYVGKLRHCVPVDELPTCAERGTVGTIGMISNCEPRLTRSREKMCTFRIETQFASFRCIAFPKTYARYADKLTDNSPVYLSGRVTYDEAFESYQMIVESVLDEVDVRTEFEPVLILVANKAQQDKVLDMARKNPGSHPLILDTPQGKRYKTGLSVRMTPRLIEFQKRGVC